MATQVSLNSGAVSSAGSLKLQTNGTTDAVTIDTAQNMGLGVTPSAWSTGKAIEIRSLGNGLFSDGVNDVNIVSNAYYNGGWKYAANGYANEFTCGNAAGTFTWRQASNNTLGAGQAISSWTTAMTLDASGNLMVGRTSTTYKLDVKGNAGIRAIDTDDLRSLILTPPNSGGDAAFVESSSANGLVLRANNASGFIGFTTGGTSERMRIDSSGNLLVGTTSPGLQSSGLTFNPNSGAAYTALGHQSGTSTGVPYLYFGYNAGIIGSITQNGTTGVLYNLTSDYRLKNDPQPLTGAKDFVMALQPKKWQWWDGSGEGVGFIAHEFMEVAKYSGNGEKDAVDENGNPVYQTIQPSSSEVMANLVALLQEQQAIINAQASVLQQLQADVAALKG